MPYNPTPPSYIDPKFKAYRDAIMAMPPICTDERANEYVRLWEEFHGQVLCPEVLNPKASK